MSDLEELAHLREKVTSMRRQTDKAEGSLERLAAQLKEEFDCDSIEEAKTLLVKLKTKEKKAEQSFSKALAKFKEKWEEVL